MLKAIWKDMYNKEEEKKERRRGEGRVFIDRRWTVEELEVDASEG